MLCLNLFESLKKIDIYYGVTFNIYDISLIILASIISGLGLLYNSTSTILGSMLISSIANPLIASSIYLILNYYSKSIYKISNFFILVIICFFIALSIGYTNKVLKIFETPTKEMLSRITYTHVVVDVILALISGIALALSILNTDVIIRTGVSLILSMTPPLVNFGIFYGEILYNYLQLRKEKNNIEKNTINKKIEKLSLDGNKSFILFMLNIIAMYTTLLLTLTILCR
jgi:hypothetical protein